MTDTTSFSAPEPVDERHRVEYPGMWLRLPCCDGTVHPVRVKRQGDGVVVITAPKEPHVQWIRRPEPTESITLGWTDTGGTLVLECSVSEENLEDGTWSLLVLSTQDFLQRRRHVRVSSDAEVKLIDGVLTRTVTGRVLDISESGMRCSFQDFIPARQARPYQFALQLEHSALVVTCELAWVGRVGPVEVQAGFEFVDTYESLLTRLRSYVMLQLDTRGPFQD